MKKFDSRICVLLAGLLSSSVFAAAPVSSAGDSQSLSQQVAILKRMTESQSSVQLQSQQQLQAMQNDINQLRGQLEVQNHRIDQMLSRQREIYQTLDQLQSKAGGATSSSVSATEAATSQPSGPVVSADENQAYEHAIDLVLKDKKYDQAIPAFRDFIKRYPKSGYVPNAYYWLGQLLFSQSQYPDAAKEFQALVDGYKSSTKRPDALLKLGVIAQMQGKSKDAKIFYQQLIKEYPDNSSAFLAKDRLKQL
ncbi:tol-pal system protein YbgF [Dongshaea marina]|uniref:tol-pal system protein YbgF n=1 Tax=Dongshaea marina TaxID=2047966 RepID=UPI000D3E3C72|nr:tol-pal system protein YbgF [Dongshaea marina]